MPTISRTVTVQKPAHRVWDYLSDFTNSEQWDPGSVSTRRTSGDGSVGTVYANVSKVLGANVDITYTVTAHEPGRLLQLRGETGSMTMTDTIQIESVDGATAVTYTAEFEPKGAAKLAEPLMPLGLKRLGDNAADSLHEHLSNL